MGWGKINVDLLGVVGRVGVRSNVFEIKLCFFVILYILYYLQCSADRKDEMSLA